MTFTRAARHVVNPDKMFSKIIKSEETNNSAPRKPHKLPGLKLFSSLTVIRQPMRKMRVAYMSTRSFINGSTMPSYKYEYVRQPIVTCSINTGHAPNGCSLYAQV